ncbi:MAG: N-acetyltransferase [Verrucomicrobia bacterium]|nr:N-acetyltransferase [Verrucomicrobiota bacterium]
MTPESTAQAIPLPRSHIDPAEEVVVRDAREADLAAIVAIYNEAVASRSATAQLEPVEVEERRPWFAEHSAGHHPLWVAEYGGAVAAWLSFHEFLPRCAYDGTAELSLYVSANFRRRGLGLRLLREAIARAPHLGLDTLVALIFAQNEASLRLFAQLGFNRWGLLPGVARVDGAPRDLVILGRRV